MSPLLGRTDHAARTLPIADERHRARAHQGAAARPPRAALVGARLARRRRAGRPRRPVGDRPGRAGGHHRRRQPGAASTGSSRCSSRRSSLQTVLTWVARRASFVLAERIFARLREDFITSSVRLPLSVVERAGTGDLVARTTNDVESLAHIIRFGIPAIVVAVTTVVATTVAAVPHLAAGRAARCSPPRWCTCSTSRWYLKRAGDGYLWEHASYAAAQRGRLRDRRRRPHHGRPRAAGGPRPPRSRRRSTSAATPRRYTLRPAAALVPVARDRLLPADRRPPCCGVAGWPGTATSPIARRHRRRRSTCSSWSTRSASCISWLDEIQVARHVAGPDHRRRPRCRPTGSPPGRSPTASRSTSTTCATPTARAATCCTASRSGCVPGERLAIVGPSGAGKSTLGRLMAGIDGPRTGPGRPVGGVPLVDLDAGRAARRGGPGDPGAPRLRRHPRRQPAAGPARGDATTSCARRCAPSTPSSWAAALPDGLDTVVGSGGHALTEAQAQQLALARLVLADPHTLVLDEATSLLDPRAARHLERSLAAVVDGRTVVAIAHRLHTAHDADRVAVVEDGVVSELGSHDELIAARRVLRRAVALLARRELSHRPAQSDARQPTAGPRGVRTLRRLRRRSPSRGDRYGPDSADAPDSRDARMPVSGRRGGWSPRRRVVVEALGHPARPS